MKLISRLFISIPALTRWGVSLAVTFSAVTAFILAKKHLDHTLLYLMAGVFMLASGASALNQFQEKKFDALMDRTKNRPLVTGIINLHTGLFLSIIFIATGSLLLFIVFGKIPALLGLFTVIWYNGLYTYLKQKSSFAIIPGALTGALPALIGWTARGAYLFDKKILVFALFIFVWQVPHFWILLLKYNQEYINAGFKTITQKLSLGQIKIVIASWIISTSFISLLFPLYGIITDIRIIFPLLLLNATLVFLFFTLVFKNQIKSLKFIHLGINIFLILSMVLILIEQIL